MSAVEFFSIVKDIALGSAAAITAYVALTGLEKWQKELRGKANFEIARLLIKSIYHLRDELGHCRSPFISAHEFPEEYNAKGLGRHTSEEEGQAYNHIYSKRWAPVGTALQEFDAALLEGEALWGASIKEKGLVLRQCVRSLQVDIDCVITNKFSGGEEFKDKDYAKKVRAGVSASRAEDNELSNRINAAVEGLEQEIRPHLARS